MDVFRAANRQHAKLSAMSRLNLEKFFAPIASKLESVESELQKIVQSEITVVSRLAEHISKGSGKRLRPALVLLASRFCGGTSDKDVRYGAVFELLHTATLIHDDIIDHAPIRRGRPSLNAEWGSTLSVLFGDFLYLQAMQITLADRNWRTLDIFADVITRMVEGELIQNECLYRPDVSRKTYFDIIERKTAILFAACAEVGAILAERDENFCRNMYRFGLELGRAFQLVDDLLDYTSTSDHLGKPVFSDLREGKLTLPMLALLEKAPASAMPVIARVWGNNPPSVSPEDANLLLELLKQHGSLEEARELAGQASSAALDSLSANDGDPEMTRALREITETLLERTY
ncbi:MAG: polyprenyl synthetase family protein [Holophagales bacterium]|jgi:octaprenyl-diphosphate synthase|nr:polyprenyl synthetase family protein [Holophagales bacterium]